jgi:hypothetical protein
MPSIITSVATIVAALIGLLGTLIGLRALRHRKARHRRKPEDSAIAPTGLSARIDSLLVRWLVMVRKHGLAVHVAVATMLFVILYILLHYVFHLESGLPHGIAIELIIVLTASVAMPFIITFLPLRRQIHAIIKRLITMGPVGATDVVFRLISEELTKLDTDLEDLRGDGIDVTTETVPGWVRVRCWHTMNGRYIGTDSNLPSEYNRIYADYLESHKSYLSRTGRDDSVRIIFRTQASLERDSRENPEKYRDFVDWHKKNKVDLKILSPHRAEKLAKHHTTKGVTDMACWDGELVLLWRCADEPNQVERLKMTFVEEDLYNRCRSFLDAVLAESEEFPSIDRQISE